MKWFKNKIIRWALRQVPEIRSIKEKVVLHKNNNVNLWSTYNIKQNDIFHESRPGRSHNLEDCHNPLVLREEIFYHQGALEAWCEDMCEGRFIIYFNDDAYHYFFEDENDALLFKLTWC